MAVGSVVHYTGTRPTPQVGGAGSTRPVSSVTVSHSHDFIWYVGGLFSGSCEVWWRGAGGWVVRVGGEGCRG